MESAKKKKTNEIEELKNIKLRARRVERFAVSKLINEQ